MNRWISEMTDAQSRDEHEIDQTVPRSNGLVVAYASLIGILFGSALIGYFFTSLMKGRF
jgi:hypothetical protein